MAAVIYLCAAITLIVADGDKAMLRCRQNENRLETMEKFDERENLLSDNVLVPDELDWEVGDLASEAEDGFVAGVKGARNLGGVDKENYDTNRVGHIDYSSEIKREKFTRNASPRSLPNEDGDSRTKYEIAAYDNSATKLQFPTCPAGETIAVENLEERYLPFGVFSSLMASLQPSKFPLGVLKDAAERRVPFHVFLLQVAKLEGFAVAWILLWAVLSLCIPCAAIAQICCPAKKLRRLEDRRSSNSSLDLARIRSVRFPGFVLHTLLIALIANLILMMSSNEQLTKSMALLPGRAEMILSDLQRFIRNTEMQITFVTVTSFDCSADALLKNLDDVEILIGLPLQEEFKNNFNLDTVFDLLKKIENETLQVSHRVKSMLRTSALAFDVTESLQEKLDELIPLLNGVHQQCSERDRPLCETLLSSGLVVTFHADEIISDVKLKYLAGISADPKFNVTLREAETNYRDVPRRVSSETELQRAEIRNSLRRQRIAIHKALRTLEEVSRSAISTIKSGGRKLVSVLEDIASRDMWRYLAILGVSIFTFATWVCLMCGSPCGCENTVRSIPYLIIGLTLASLISLFLWILGSGALLLGTHGQNIICDALYDPNFEALSELLDDDGILYPNSGLIKHLLRSNESVKIAELLRNSHLNQSSYTTLKLHNFVEVTELLNYNNWTDLNQRLNKFHVDTKNFMILTVSLETYLMDLCAAAKLNFANYRKKLSASATAKDLSAFLDQVYAITKQIGDPKTASRLEKLSFKLRDILKNEYRNLNEYKDSILYDVTALEVTLKPIEQQFQFVLEKLRMFQLEIRADKSDGPGEITRHFISDLKSYLEQSREHVTFQVTRNLGKVKPLWIIFDTSRNFICEQIVDDLNALSFSCFLSIFLVIALTPVTKRIIRYYREINEDLLSPIIRRNASDETIRRGRANWGTPPAPGTPVQNFGEESVWASPRQAVAVDSHVPSPPRPPSDSKPESSSRSPQVTPRRWI